MPQRAPAKLFNKLQVAQNQAARLINRTKRSEHITQVLHKLHWLPVHVRITYKVLVLVYKCLHQGIPSYLCEELTLYKPNRALRSSTDSLRLVIPKCSKSYGESSFRNFAPKVWNDLPLSLRTSCSLSSFKKLLKTHLFYQYFNSK